VPKKVTIGVAVLILVLGLGPFVSAIGSISIANALGCRLDEGSVHACMFLGVDIGDLLYTGLVLGWLSLVTIPYGAMALIVWAIIVMIVRRVKRRRKVS
jgi:hypothetical protein